MTELAFVPAVELTDRLRRGEVGSRELLDLYLDRIDRFGGGLNAVVTLDVERARARADEADAARAQGLSWGPLHGLPLTVKDVFETAGLRTTCGVPALADHVPAEDAVAVARLRAAGAVLFGKTNTPAWAMDVVTRNDLFGETVNPWASDRSPGGSSGGAAAAVAAGLTSLELGSDLGGSIRYPAHFCGVFGLKPTWGLVPSRGHIPPPPGALGEMDVCSAGPLGRAAEDLELVLSVIAGADEPRATAWRVELPPPRAEHVAVWLDDPAYPIAADVRRLLEDAAASVGAVEVSAPVSLLEVTTLNLRLLAPIGAGLASPEVAERWRVEAAARDYEPDPRDAVAWQHWAGITHTDWLAADEERQRLAARWREAFADFDAVLLPVAPVPAIPKDQAPLGVDRWLEIDGVRRGWRELFAWSTLPGTVHLPAVSAPVGLTPDGLPVGVQVVAAYGHDRTAIEVARRLGRFVAPPAFVHAAA